MVKRRVKGNFKRKDNQNLILCGTSKDDKDNIDPLVGPDSRPIMGAMVGPNIGLNEIGSVIVSIKADIADTGLVSNSTEEVLNKLEIFNKRRLNIDFSLVASMDIWVNLTRTGFTCSERLVIGSAFG